jgi:hypothetical protein
MMADSRRKRPPLDQERVSGLDLSSPPQFKLTRHPTPALCRRLDFNKLIPSAASL